MRDDLVERIETCIEVEKLSAEVYNAFSVQFPEAMSFFMGLSKEEENHITILEVAKAYSELGKLPDRVVPGPLSEIQATRKLLSNIIGELKSRRFSLKEAVELAVSLESSTSELYLPEQLIKETDDEVLLKLKKLLFDEQLHLEKINDFRESRGV